MIFKLSEIVEERLNFKDLEKIENRVTGYLVNQQMNDSYLVDLSRDYFKKSDEHIDIQYGFRIVVPDELLIRTDKIIINNSKTFECGKIIASQLKEIEGIVIFAATLGHSFDKWLKQLFNANDPLGAYIVDLIGSFIVESAVDFLAEKIDSHFEDQNKKCSNRYSPGYCDWDVIEQKKVFSFLPKDFCGITLTKSALMLPIKSVSGIIGFGEKVKRVEYNCSVCKQENCYMYELKKSNKNG